jgi:hypothetical protein
MLTLAVGAIGTILAGFAIKLGKTQEAISKRQAAIAETQFQIQKQALDKKSTLALNVLKHVTLSADASEITYKLIVENTGTKTAPDGSWLVQVEKADSETITITPLHPSEVIQRLVFKTEADVNVIQFTHDLTRKLYPGETSMEAEITITRALFSHARPIVTLKWAAICEDGEVLGTLELTNVVIASEQPHA